MSAVFAFSAAAENSVRAQIRLVELESIRVGFQLIEASSIISGDVSSRYETHEKREQ